MLTVILFWKRCQTEHLWLLWEILVGLKGEGGSAVAMKGRYLLILGFLDTCSHSLSFCCQILLHEMKLKYLSEQQSFMTARLSACDRTCDESLGCQLRLTAEPLSADRRLLSGKHLQPPEWRPQLLLLSVRGPSHTPEELEASEMMPSRILAAIVPNKSTVLRQEETCYMPKSIILIHFNTSFNTRRTDINAEVWVGIYSWSLLLFFWNNKDCSPQRSFLVFK